MLDHPHSLLRTIMCGAGIAMLGLLSGCSSDGDASSPSSLTVEQSLDRSSARPFAELDAADRDTVRRAIRIVEVLGELDLGDEVIELGGDESDRAPDGSFAITQEIDARPDLDSDGDVDAVLSGRVHQAGQIETVSTGPDSSTDVGSFTANGSLTAVMQDSGYQLAQDETSFTFTGGALVQHLDFSASNSVDALQIDGLVLGLEHQGLTGTWSDGLGSGAVVVDGGFRLDATAQPQQQVSYRIGITVDFQPDRPVRIESAGSLLAEDILVPDSIAYYIQIDGVTYGPIDQSDLDALVLGDG